MSRIAIGVCCGVLLSAISPPVLAQQTKLERDVEFVRKLATELRFISLAQGEVENLQRSHRDSDNFKLVSQLGIEISLIGARSHPNREERRTMFHEALEKSRNFINATDGEPVADQARLTMIEACYEYGRFLLDEIEIAREEAPDQVKDLEEGAASVYRDGVDACEKVMETLRAAEGDKRIDYFRCWLLKGVLLRENARAIRKDRAHLAVMSRDTLEELIFEVGEESGLGMRAFFEMSKIGEVLDNLDRAISDYKDVIDSICVSLRDEDGVLNLNEATKEFLFNLLQEAYDRAVEAMFMQGRIADVLELCKQFRDSLAEFGLEGADEFEVANPQFGHSVFLTEARAMAESGDPDLVAKALPHAQKINDLHPNDILGIKAKGVLKDITSAQTVSGELLFEVAKGDYQARDYEVAIQGLKRAYASMTPAESKAHGLELWTMIGTSFGFQKRYLEASMALIKALEDHGQDEGSPETTADALELAWGGYSRDSKSDDDPALDPIKQKVSHLLTRYGGASSAGKMMWREGNKLFGEEKYAEATAAYAKVTTDTPYYEPAQGRMVVAQQVSGDHDKARADIARYLAWIETPDARIPSDRKDMQVIRQQTLATMAFYDAYMNYREATGLVGEKTDPTRFADILAQLQAFLSEHRQYGGNYVPRTYDMIARLHAQLGQIAKAEENYRTLRNLDANSPLLPQLATQIFATHNDTVKALELEYAAVVDNKDDAAKIKAVAGRLETARKAALASGLDYLRNSPDPQYGVLWNSLQIARDVAEWQTAEEIGKKTIEAYGASPDTADKVTRFVKPILGESYLRRGRFREAVDLLTEVETAVPSDYPVKRLLSLAQGGWFDLNKVGDVREVPGLDDPVPAYQRYWREYKKYALNASRGVEDYTYPWYEFYYECFCLAKRAGRKDSKYKDTAATLYNIAKSFDNFETLKNLGPEGESLFRLFQQVRSR